ncbi:MAG: cytochrome c oxidase subunit II [Mycobacteriales bacterium]
MLLTTAKGTLYGTAGPAGSALESEASVLVRPFGRRLPSGPRPFGVRVLAIAAMGLLTGCAPTGGSVESREIGDFYNVVFFLALVVFVGVNGALLYFVTKYRRRPTDVGMPPQIHGSTIAEVTWTVLPALLVFGLFGMSWSSMRSVDRKDEPPNVTVNVQGYQWNWEFDYGNNFKVKAKKDADGKPLVPLMKVPVGERIRFVLTSDNVIHSFFLPEMLFKRDVVPGRLNQFDITIDSAGLYKGQCAEFCGTDHALMNFQLQALNRADFEAWVKDEKANSCAGEPAGTLELASPPGQIAYDKDCLVAPAGQPVKLTYTNGGGQPHNVLVVKSEKERGTLFGKSGDPIPSGTETGEIAAQPAGQYFFFCQVHPVMNGTYKVQ